MPLLRRITMPVKASSSIETLQVVADAGTLTSRAGIVLVAGVADRIGLTAGLSEALGSVRERRSRHDCGRVVRDLALSLADGGDCLADLRALRDQPSLLGEVASDATAWRAISALDEQRLQAIRVARAQARARVWEQVGMPGRVILDIDATLVTAHSEKEGAAGTYKGGFGFHPLLCYEAESEEALAGLLRPGNAGSNTASDHIEVLERSLAQLPEQAIGQGLLVRCDRAGATHAFLDHVDGRGLGFSVGLDLTEPVRQAILALPEQAWRPALASNGAEREGAWVAELPLDLTAWPARTRAICRRERPHPGAQLSFSDRDGHRFQVFLTNQPGARIARLEQLHRARASCEDRIRCDKQSGLRNLPFRAFEANAAWLELVLIGHDLLVWTQRLLLAGTELSRCEPKRLRYRLLHVAARLTRHARQLVLHLPRHWPWREALLQAFERLRALPTA
jgi:hypothetical protein